MKLGSLISQPTPGALLAATRARQAVYPLHEMLDALNAGEMEMFWALHAEHASRRIAASSTQTDIELSNANS